MKNCVEKRHTEQAHWLFFSYTITVLSQKDRCLGITVYGVQGIGQMVLKGMRNRDTLSKLDKNRIKYNLNLYMCRNAAAANIVIHLRSQS